MKKTIYFIRHGESEDNAGTNMVGATSALSEKGRAQASFVAQRAAKLPIDVIISSTMERAKQTAQAIVELTGKPIEYTDLIVERGMPTSGLGRSVLDPESVKIEDLLMEKLIEHDFRHSDEENFNDMKERVAKALTYLEARTEENIVMVSHGAFLKFMIAVVIFGNELTGKEARLIMRKLKTMNTGITIFEYDPEHKYGPWRLVVYNDHAHLG